MDDWQRFDDSEILIPKEIFHLDLPIIKRVLYVLHLCEKRSWTPFNIVVHEKHVSVSWQVPVYREILIFYDCLDEKVNVYTSYDSLNRTIEMSQLESSLVWHLSRELRLKRMKEQFCDLFKLDEQQQY